MSNEDRETDGTGEFEVEQLVTREACAAALRRLAVGIVNGSVELGDKKVTVAIPEQLELEVEYEEADEEAELEVEMEWPIVNGEAVATERASEPPAYGDTEATEMGEDEAEKEGRDGVVEDDNPIEGIVGEGVTESKAHFELYRDRTDEWRWRLVHDNGNIIADSGEGYDRKATARNGLESVMHNAPGAAIVVLEG